MSNTNTKKNLAKACRMAANSIDKYGWVQRMYGNTKEGFCMAGAFNYAANSLSLQPVPEEVSVSAFLACGGTRAELKRLRMEYGHPEKCVHIPTWNDVILTPEDGKDRVTSFFRKLARHLEHGGHL